MLSRARKSLRLLASVLAAEGPRAVLDRLQDRLAERRRSRSYAPLGDDDPGRFPLVNLLSTPPDPRFGGVQAQYAARIGAESAGRPVATIYPEGGGLRMDLESGGIRRSLRTIVGNPGRRPAVEDRFFEEAVSELARRVGATSLHVENPAGFPLRSLARLVEVFPAAVSIHDFTLNCARSDLLEQPAGTFCGYGASDRRCHACLRADRSVESDFPTAYRRAGRDLLSRAHAVVFPSSFLRSRFAELFPGIDSAGWVVIAPSGGPAAGPFAAESPIRRVAFVGSVTVQKGARELGRLFATLAPRFPRVRWIAYGKGDPRELARLRSLGRIRVRGYHRTGTLPSLLRRDRIDLALALSVTPESYGLVVDECLSARVPVVAFDHGAPAERLRGGGGVLVDPSRGAPGLAEAVGELLGGTRVPPPFPGGFAPENAAARHLVLYRERGLLPG
jgi:glycosyl transferase family 1